MKARLRRYLSTSVCIFAVLTMVTACSSSGGGGGDFPTNDPPIASFTVDPASGDAPLTVAFDASASSDTDGEIVSYAWNFGDGSASGTGVMPTHTFENDGVFSVTLTVRDNDGASNATSRTISVGNQAPVAAFTAEPNAGFAPLTVSFDASASRDPDGNIVEYAWDFGDGGAAAGVIGEHTFEDAGTYVVELTVTDDDGASDRASDTITARSVTSVTRFDITVLPSLPNRETFPAAINNRGDVAGTAEDAVGNLRAFVYFEEVLFDLLTLGGNNASAWDLNDTGQVAGWSELVDGSVRAFLFTAATRVMEDLGTLGGTYSAAYSINQSGHVVGTSDNDAGAERAFLYVDADSGMQDLGTLGGLQSRANAINNLGQIVGDSSTVIAGEEHAFLYSNGVMEDIGTLGGSLAYANDINDAAQVVGVSSTAQGELSAFIYSEGEMVPLGLFGGQRSDASGINNHGQVVGFTDFVGFLWDEVNGLRDLNEMIGADPGWLILEAISINDRGQIVGVGFDGTNNLQRPVLLTPVE